MCFLPHLDPLLFEGLITRKPNYAYGCPMIVTFDTNQLGIGWVVNPDNEDGDFCTICFETKVLR